MKYIFQIFVIFFIELKLIDITILKLDIQETWINQNKINKNNQLTVALIPLEIESRKPRIFTDQTNGSQNMSLNTWRQARAVIIVCSCMFYFAFNRALIASVVNSQTSKQFRALFNYTGNIITTNAILSSVSPLGAFFGTILCSYLIRVYSVRQILFSNCLFSIIFTVVTMYTEIIVLLIFRFFIGWTIGTYVAVIPSFIKEITSKDVAPYFGTAPVINQSLGGLFAFAIGFGLYEATGKVRDTWVIMCILNIIPLVIVMICIKIDLVYESPIYLLKNGQRQKAVNTYELIYKSDYISTIIKQKQLEINKFYFTQVRLLLNFSNKSILKRKDILIGIHLPVLRKMSGVLIIILSSGTMIKTVDPKYQRTVPVIISLVYFISCFLSNVVLKFMTRRATFQLGAVSLCILNLCLALFFYYQVEPQIIVAFQIFVIIMYGLTFGPLVWPYLPQIVPARLIPLAQASNWFVDVCTLSLPGVIIAHHDSPWPIFLVLSLWNFFSIIINHFLIIQTKLKTMNEILAELNK